MKSSFRSALISAAAATLVITTAGLASGDALQGDGDDLVTGTTNVLDLGAACAGDELGSTVSMWVRRNANLQNSFAASQTLAISATGLSGGVTSTDPSDIALPATWLEPVPQGTQVDSSKVTGDVAVTAGSVAGEDFSGALTFQASGKRADDQTKTLIKTLPIQVVWDVLEDDDPLCVEIVSDTTAPTSSAAGSTSSGPYTFGHWTNQDVTLTLTGQDESGGSGLKEIRYTTDGSTPTASHGSIYDPSNKPVVSSDGITAVQFVAIDNQGNVESPVNTVTVKLDKTAPVITDDSATTLPQGTKGSNDWWTSDVTVTFKASDGLSGFTSPLADPHTFTKPTSGEGPAVTVASGTVDDVAGNTSNSVTSASFKIDKTAPTLTCSTTTPTFVLGSVGTVTASVADVTSGPATLTVSASAVTSSVGAKSIELTGYDNAGLSGSVMCSYSVIYAWDGFFRPVDNLPTLNSVKAGSAIPVKFSLGGDQGLDIMTAGYPKSQVIACDSDAQVDGVEQTLTAGSSSLSFDASTGQYIYVWKTEKAWAGTCRQLVVSLDDGTVHRANFKLLK